MELSNTQWLRLRPNLCTIKSHDCRQENAHDDGVHWFRSGHERISEMLTTRDRRPWHWTRWAPIVVNREEWVHLGTSYGRLLPFIDALCMADDRWFLCVEYCLIRTGWRFAWLDSVRFDVWKFVFDNLTNWIRCRGWLVGDEHALKFQLIQLL